MVQANTVQSRELKQGGVLEGVTLYHWLVVLIASAGWLFDCMDARLFALARQPAITQLLSGASEAWTFSVMGKTLSIPLRGPELLQSATTYFGFATTSMMLGWGTGGIIFGIMSDKWGRVKTMVAALLVYSGCTGLSGLSHNWIDFVVYRFLVGLGIGGMFGAATTLVAESVPGRFRAMALGSLQALSATGNIMGSLLSVRIQPGDANSLFGLPGWRVLFFVGILPALLVVPILFVLKEPEPWKKAKAEAMAAGGKLEKRVGSPIELFANRRWRHNLVIGLLLGLSGMAGLWSIGFYSPELISTALEGEPQSKVDTVRGFGLAIQDLGSFTGMLVFTFVASFLSRRVAFLGAFILSFFVTMFVFGSLDSAADAFWMLPMMGFAQLALFAGYTIYFPELFPTRLRGTGVSFCYNAVRYLTAPFPILLGHLTSTVFAGHAEPFRVAAMVMSSIYLVGLVALWWAPETKGQPLPEG